ncbi:MAG: alkaline phosphatase D family protein [Bacteroidales bacterium]|nr:alkaline phosphatase D family protein [Bacteroidales bacterium]
MKPSKVSLIIVLFLSIISYGLSQKHGFDPERYCFQHREAIQLIADGEMDQAIELAESFIDENSEDIEAIYVQAVAHAQKGEIKKAMDYVDKSLELGISFSRYLAGPRDLLKPLVNSEPFRQRMKDNGPYLLHGPMLSNVTDSRAEFWVRTFRENSVSVVVKELGKDKTIQSETVETDASRDYTATIPVTGLEANTEYQYIVVVGDKEIGNKATDKRWVFRTYPQTGEPTTLAVGFGGGAGYTPFYNHMWNTLSARWLPAFLFLGDNVYIDHPKYPQVQDYCYYRRHSSAEYKNFIARTSIYAIWDDHDFGQNDSWGTPSKDEPEWKIPVWEKYKDNWNNPYYGGEEEDPGVWTDFSIGDVDFFMLDGRYYRSSPTLEKPDMLGEAQKEWLFEKLKQSDATFKVIASPVPWSFGVKGGTQTVYGPSGTVKPSDSELSQFPPSKGTEVPRTSDTWEGYAEEREKIFSFIEENNIEGVVLISADRHRSDAWKITREDGYDFYEFESSKLTNVHTHPVFPESIFGYNEKCSFGLLKFNTEKRDPEVTYKVVNIDNEVMNEITLRRSQLEFDR